MPVTQVMNCRKVAVRWWVVCVEQVKECPQVVQRQRVVPLLVVPYCFVVCRQMGLRGRLVVTWSLRHRDDYHDGDWSGVKVVGIAVGELLINDSRVLA